jgi:hypothetical protein
VDAFATPFVQGRLRNQSLAVTVRSECAHCGRAMEIEIDSDLNYRTPDAACRPIVFVPDIKLTELEAPSIIDDF